MSLERYNTKVDWQRKDEQEGLATPSDRFAEREYRAVAVLSPELRAEREFLISKLSRVNQVYQRYGTGIENRAIREARIKEIRNENNE